ncbi:MAG: DUF721 domain-containing protein [Piscirickettsiaceae bacterium]|nr:DUF721 domain-containing protein [Piscirickettsiaceae bacterium]
MTKQPENIRSIFQQNSALHQLSQRSQHLEQLNYLLKQALPSQFSAHCRLANMNNGTLIIHTDNASYASLIRFQAPVIIKTLSTELKIEIAHLDVKVRPIHTPLQSQPTHNITLPSSAARALQQTAGSLEDGPLKDSLEKLSKRFND